MRKYVQGEREWHAFFRLFLVIPVMVSSLAVVPLIGVSLDGSDSASWVFYLFVAGPSILVMVSLHLRGLSLMHRWRREVLGRTALIDCCGLIEECAGAAVRRGSLLRLNRSVSFFVISLGNFAHAGLHQVSLASRASVAAHVAEVQFRLNQEMDSVMRRGVDSLPRMLALLSEIVEGLVHEKWQGLISEEQRPEAEVTLEYSVRESSRSRWLALAGATMAVAVMTVAAAAGVPAPTLLPLVLTVVLLTPALFWGGNRLGVTPRSFLDSVREGASQGGSAP